MKMTVDPKYHLRELVPTRDPEVAKWLEFLAGPEHHRNLLSWLGCVTDPGMPDAALALSGSPGVGKTLLAFGISRLWTTRGPTSFSGVLTDPQGAISECPFVAVEENLPVGRHRKAPAAAPPIRLMIATNDEDISVIQDQLRTLDLKTIGDRLYHIRVHDEAAAYLETVDAGGFVEQDRIARHVLSLRDGLQNPC